MAPERSDEARKRAFLDLSRWLLSWNNADVVQLWYFGLAIKNHVGNMDTPVEDALVSMVESYGWSVNDPTYPECTIQTLREHLDDAGHFFTDTLNIANYVNTRYPQAIGRPSEREVRSGGELTMPAASTNYIGTQSPSTNFVGKQTRYSLVKSDKSDNYSLEVLYLSKREHELVRAFVTTLLRSDPVEPMPKVEKRRHCRDLNVGSPEVDNEGHPLIPGCTPYSMTRWSPDDLTVDEYEIPLAEQEFLFMRRVLTLLHGPAYLAGKEESVHA